MSEVRPDPEGARYINPPGNSHRSKEESDEKDIRQVTSQAARLRKKRIGTRIKESFTGDSAKSVGDYLIFDVTLPAIQNLFVDAFQQGVERLIMGDSRPNRTRRSNERSRGYTTYNRYYEGRPDSRSGGSSPRRDYSDRARASHDFDEIILDSRGEAEEVLDYLADLLSKYDQVTVSDLYRIVGIRGSYVDGRWGWTHLRDARPQRVRDGYVLELPAPVDLDRRV